MKTSARRVWHTPFILEKRSKRTNSVGRGGEPPRTNVGVLTGKICFFIPRWRGVFQFLICRRVCADEMAHFLAFPRGEGGPSRRWMRRSNFVQYKRRAPHPSLAILLRKMYHFVNAIATFPTGEGLVATTSNAQINTNLYFKFWSGRPDRRTSVFLQARFVSSFPDGEGCFQILIYRRVCVDEKSI